MPKCDGYYGAAAQLEVNDLTRGLVGKYVDVYEPAMKLKMAA